MAFLLRVQVKQCGHCITGSYFDPNYYDTLSQITMDKFTIRFIIKIYLKVVRA